MAGILLLHRDEDVVGEDALGGHVVIDDLGQGKLQGREHDALAGPPHVVVLGGRPAHHGGRIDGVLSVSDRLDVEHGVVVFERVVAGVVAERPLRPELPRNHIPFEDDLGLSGDFEVVRLALDQFDGFVTDEARGDELVDIGGQGHRAGPD